MELGLGWLRLSPKDFWSLTLRELSAAMDGYVHSKGGETATDKSRQRDTLLRMLDDLPEQTLADGSDASHKPPAQRVL